MPPKIRGRPKGKGRAPSQNVVPDVYRDMLAEAIPTQSEVPERPLKKRRVGMRGAVVPASESGQSRPPAAESHDGDEDDENVEFEDIATSPKVFGDEGSDEDANKLQQTAYRDSDEETTDESDAEVDTVWENIDFNMKDDEPARDLELNLTRPAPQRQLTTTPRRKALTQADKNFRLDIHKLHILCLLSHVERRNKWCSNSIIQDSLYPLLSKKMLDFLRPRKDLSQFSQADSLKRGLDMAAVIWRTKFQITKRGMRRALWADNEDDIKNVRFLIAFGYTSSDSMMISINYLMMRMHRMMNRISKRQQRN